VDEALSGQLLTGCLGWTVPDGAWGWGGSGWGGGHHGPDAGHGLDEALLGQGGQRLGGGGDGDAPLLGDLPGRGYPVTGAQLTGRDAAAAVGSGGRVGVGELGLRPDLGDAGVLLDGAAKAAYRARLVEREFLVAELARAVGLGGRDRRAAAHAERARLNVTRAIRAAMAKLARANPALGRHLAVTIRTGRYCAYTPDPRAPIAWQR
jgi:hypothetical protein